MENISRIGSIVETNSKLNTSQLRKFIYGDHNSAGYGEQDGYDGPERKYNPTESLDESALKDVKGALEKLINKKQYEEDSEIDEDFLEEIEGISHNNISMNQIQSFEQQQERTIFNQKQKNDLNYQHINNEEFKKEYEIQVNLQIIKEEQESKGTQYNLNNGLSSSQVRNHNQQYQIEQDQKNANKNGFDKIDFDEISNNENFIKNTQKNTILKKNIDSQISKEQNDQKGQKQLKVQFIDNTSIDTLDGKTGDKMNSQQQKR
ncbi:unnamed protein product [Paramecium primaurelia]|nr:unnamed protein product [Paramecium primaurelia]